VWHACIFSELILFLLCSGAKYWLWCFAYGVNRAMVVMVTLRWMDDFYCRYRVCQYTFLAAFSFRLIGLDGS